MSAAGTTCLAAAAGLLLALTGCNRGGDAPGGTAPPAGAAAPASAASAPASAASAAAVPPLVPERVALASGWTEQEVQAGGQIAAQGGGGAVTACVSCHGPSGEGNAQANFPRLAGQGKLYLVHQLESYANGSRKNPVMQPIAAAMSDVQRQQSAAFYASRSTQPAATGPAAPPREPVLAARGDDGRQLQACANCHGPQGVGDAAFNPYLAGQHAGYLTAALAEWKGGDRNNDPSGQMPLIAKALTDEEVRTLVAYYSSLPPPSPRNAQAAAGPLPAGRQAVQSGPAGATAPTQGVGTEQGALTGGAQAQGAGGGATNPQQTPQGAGAPQAPASAR
ncbi:MAG TPA: c-type cytochrome [Ramlibacter sp.]|jgi:cytochrome c553|uniref:c-type cytochrome n=1 Tax=Ramlibacter sp. TaxID=1917967 RepID=UPI002D5028E9|nr:c-type cytochrome [Ramlibacter sp.]HZY18282.1 c-type cytochrome [Ramlibacter sp.]